MIESSVRPFAYFELALFFLWYRRQKIGAVGQRRDRHESFAERRHALSRGIQCLEEADAQTRPFVTFNLHFLGRLGV